MIQIENVSFAYNNSDGGALSVLFLKVRKGECILVCGGSGCGKTTITRLVNGLVPHFYEGDLSGTVSVCGMDVSGEELYTISKRVGSVFQNPRSQFFCLDTTSELAFGCENLGLSAEEIRSRVNRAVKDLNLESLIDRDIFKLSGGEKQRIACGCVSAMNPDIYVLDEPTSNLDAESIERLKSVLSLWKGQGKTIIIAEHRLYWLKDLCDRVVYLDSGKIKLDIPMDELKTFSLSKLHDLGLRTLLPPNKTSDGRKPYHTKNSDMMLKNYRFGYDRQTVLHFDDMPLPANEIVAITGRNGAGKSTFVRCFCGLEKKFKGQTIINGKAYKLKDMLRKCYLVMQDVNHQLFCESVEDEVLLGAADDTDDTKEKARRLMEKLGVWELRGRHPMSLSGGQKQRVAICSAVLAGKDILVFDEPTSGLDYRHMVSTAELFKSLRSMGKSVFIITHDSELIERCCTCELNIVGGKANLYERSICMHLQCRRQPHRSGGEAHGNEALSGKG